MPWKTAFLVLLLLAGLAGCDREQEANTPRCEEGVDALLEEDQPSRAIDLLSACIDEGEVSPADLNYLLFMRAMAQLALDNREAALTDLAAAAESDPDNPTNNMVHSARGHIHGLIGDYEKAIDAFTRGMAFGSVSARQFFARGMAYFGQGDFDAAVRDLQKGQELQPERAWYALWLYIAGARAGRANRAQLEDHRRAAADHRSHMPVFELFLGDVSPSVLLEDQTDEAAKGDRLERCDRLVYVAEFHILQGKANEAIALLQEAAQADPRSCVAGTILQGELARLRRQD